MKTKCPLLLVLAILAGCVTSVPLTVTNPVSGDPIDGVQVCRFRDVNRWEKITNPVGSFYHPRIRAESVTTDMEGKALRANLGKNDLIIITERSGSPLVVRIDHLAIPMDPVTTPAEPESVSLVGIWEYYLRRQEGQWRVTMTAPEDWP